VLPKPLQNSPKTTSADTAIFPRHQQPPFTSKNSHHVVPLIPTRCTQNSNQTIPKTALFSPKIAPVLSPKRYHFTFKTALKQPWKRHKNGEKKRPVDATAVGGGGGRRHATSVDGIHRRRLSPIAAACTCPSLPPPSCLHSMCPQTLISFWLVGVLSAPHLLELAPQFFAISKMSLATSWISY